MTATAFEGALALLVRRAFTMLLGTAGVVVVARTLDAPALGVFALATTLLALGLTLSDPGLVAALLREPELPEPRALRTLFAIELLRAVLLAALIAALAPLLGSFFGLGAGERRFLAAMALSVLPPACCTVPATLLERQLAYPAIVRADLAQALAYQAALIGGALGGAGVWSFWLAAMAGGLARLPLVWLAAWRLSGRGWLGLAWSASALRRALGLGAPLQLGGLTHLLRENLPTLLAGSFYSLSDLGYLRWAQRTPASAVQPLTQSLIRASLPALSQLRGDDLAARRLASQLILALLALLLPALALAVALLPALLALLFTPRWSPAGLAFGYSAIALALGEPVMLLASICSALGLAWPALRALVAWALAFALLALALAPALGFEGVALAAALSPALPLALLGRRLRARLDIRLMPLLRGPLLAALAAGLAGWGMLPLITSLWSLALVAALGGASGLLALLAADAELRGYAMIARKLLLPRRT
jgi:teichuronic acid exporter